MKIFILILIGVLLGVIWAAKDFSPRQIQILKPDTFWKVNSTYENNGETFEVFYPPLKYDP